MGATTQTAGPLTGVELYSTRNRKRAGASALLRLREPIAFGHAPCIRASVVGSLSDPAGCSHPMSIGPVRPSSSHLRRITMKWTKPEAEVVAVTMEVTAYVATL
jgi:hypothetical protein